MALGAPEYMSSRQDCCEWFAESGVAFLELSGVALLELQYQNFYLKLTVILTALTLTVAIYLLGEEWCTSSLYLVWGAKSERFKQQAQDGICMCLPKTWRSLSCSQRPSWSKLLPGSSGMFSNTNSLCFLCFFLFFPFLSFPFCGFDLLFYFLLLDPNWAPFTLFYVLCFSCFWAGQPSSIYRNLLAKWIFIQVHIYPSCMHLSFLYALTKDHFFTIHKVGMSL